MRSTEPVERFWDLAKRATEPLLTCNYPEAEVHLVAMLDLIRSHPEARGSFEAAFLEGLRWSPDDGVPPPFELEVVVFCMHELMWPAIRDAAEKIREETNDHRILLRVREVIEAYDPAWKYEDEWEYFSSRA